MDPRSHCRFGVQGRPWREPRKSYNLMFAKKGPYKGQKTEKTGEKLKNRKFKKPYIKVVWD